MMARLSPGAVMFLLAIAAATVTAQQTPPKPQPTPPQQTFRGGVRAVPVYAAVTDGAGGFVTDLTKDDFEIKDNGKVQSINLFSHDIQPLSVVALIDGSSSMMPIFRSVLDAVNQFVVRLLPGDEARIGSFADVTRLSPHFTTNRDELLDYLRDQFNLRLGNETRLWDAVADALEAVGQRRNRKVVILFTDGDDTSSSTTLGHVMSVASDHDTIIYAVAMWTRANGATTRPDPRVEALATATGGGFYELRETDDMNSTFTSIVEELHNQYVLGFTPAALDGKTHKLEVRVKRPDMLVRARRSYVANPDAVTGKLEAPRR
jgi:Ca-activated chloride channel family protein